MPLATHNARSNGRQITIDARWLSTGIGTYTYNLVSRLKSCGDIYLRALTLERHLNSLQPFCDRVDVVNSRMYSAEEQFSVPMATREARVLHVPHYNVPVAFKGVRLVTIHDLTHILDETFSRTMKSRVYGRPMLKFAARSADHIFTVSEYSKKQIVNHLNVPPDKITVTYNGVNDRFRNVDQAKAAEIVSEQFGLNPSFVLYIGTLKPHKNVPTLLRAFAMLRKQNAIEHDLVIVGNDAVGRPALMQLAAQLGVHDFVKFIPSVPHKDVPNFYAAASVVVLPSFEEGFGLPVLEAMACGTPVICSNAASLPEVAGEAAVMFDPHDEQSLSEAIEQVLGSETLQREMRQKGIERSAKFSWNDFALRHYEIYCRYFD